MLGIERLFFLLNAKLSCKHQPQVFFIISILFLVLLKPFSRDLVSGVLLLKAQKAFKSSETARLVKQSNFESFSHQT